MGATIDPALRQRMQGWVGTDFADVRIHSDETAHRFVQQHNALAVTLGRDLHFRAGAYVPGTEVGSRLLAHELAHVAQTRRHQSGQAAWSESALDHEADHVAAQVVARRSVAVRGSAGPGAHRQSHHDRRSGDAHAADAAHAGSVPADQLVISGTSFPDAAQQVAALLAEEGETRAARLVIANGNRIRMYDQSGAPLPDGEFRFRRPVDLPAGVFRQVGHDLRLRTILRRRDHHGYLIGGLVAETCASPGSGRPGPLPAGHLRRDPLLRLSDGDTGHGARTGRTRAASRVHAVHRPGGGAPHGLAVDGYAAEPADRHGEVDRPVRVSRRQSLAGPQPARCGHQRHGGHQLPLGDPAPRQPTTGHRPKRGNPVGSDERSHAPADAARGRGPAEPARRAPEPTVATRGGGATDRQRDDHRCAAGAGRRRSVGSELHPRHYERQR